MKYILIFLLASVVTCCQENPRPETKVLPRTEFDRQTDDDATQLIDVRTADEYARGHIKHAVNIDVLQSARFKEEVKNYDHSEPIYVYCQSGGRSAKAAEQLLEMGFIRIYDLEGGYLNWKEIQTATD